MVGTVQQVTPGVLHAIPGVLVSVVLLRVEEIKKEEPGYEPVTDEVFYYQFSTNAQFGRAHICAENVGFYQAQIGDRVLLLGNTNFEIPGYMRRKQVFKILKDERVQPEPYFYLKNESLPSLAGLEF